MYKVLVAIIVTHGDGIWVVEREGSGRAGRPDTYTATKKACIEGVKDKHKVGDSYVGNGLTYSHEPDSDQSIDASAFILTNNRETVLSLSNLWFVKNVTLSGF